MALALAAFGALALFAAPASAQTPLACVHAAGFTAESAQARLVNVHRSREATRYRLASQRASDGGDDLQAAGYRDVVGVVIEMRDPSARLDDNGGVSQMALTLDPAALSPTQNAALAQSRRAARATAFELAVADAPRPARAIDYAQSHLCGD